jgi:hypothetical protein
MFTLGRILAEISVALPSPSELAIVSSETASLLNICGLKKQRQAPREKNIKPFASSDPSAKALHRSSLLIIGILCDDFLS